MNHDGGAGTPLLAAALKGHTDIGVDTLGALQFAFFQDAFNQMLIEKGTNVSMTVVCQLSNAG